MKEVNTEIFRVYVSKKEEYDSASPQLLSRLTKNLEVKGLKALKTYIRYDFRGASDKDLKKLLKINLFDQVTDEFTYKEPRADDYDFLLPVQSLPGQYDQRADLALQSLKLLSPDSQQAESATAVIYAFTGDISEEDRLKITEYLINPLEARLYDPEHDVLSRKDSSALAVAKIEGFIDFDQKELEEFRQAKSLAMSREDLLLVKDYFSSEERNPTYTEIRVLDTYWSDHCRHTTFHTHLTSLDIDEAVASDFKEALEEGLEKYKEARDFVYGSEAAKKRPFTLMDMATLAAKYERKKGNLDDEDLSEEINACSVKRKVKAEGKSHDYLIMFKNETHNHPTEMEPYGGAATCLGGAIRDPLSGRSYVHQSMRITGSADPTILPETALPGKLSQRRITTGAAAGFSSYANQIGVPAGQLNEFYHPGFMAKRMELGAVMASAPAENVLRSVPEPGDIVILLGGDTGRDGIGGATGSSKEHDESSMEKSGAQVQKGNPLLERRIQRLFRNPDFTKLIKRCNDFGAGGVSVAIGELADGLDIDLDKVPVKYPGLDGTELAISESQERMALVVEKDKLDQVLALARAENLQAVKVAVVTDDRRMRISWRGEYIVDLSRDFLDTNGADQEAKVLMTAPLTEDLLFSQNHLTDKDFPGSLTKTLSSLAHASRKSLSESFDSTAGGNAVIMPYGGKYQLSPEKGMAALISHKGKSSQTAGLMTYGYNPELSSWSPYHGAYYAVLESLAKLVAMGGDYRTARLSLQEYFERLGDEPVKWGKPAMALLGALKAQLDFGTPAIGGKDSMSGSFMDLHVPPTLVSFAVNTVDADRVLPSNFTKKDCLVLALKPLQDGRKHLPDPSSVKTVFEIFEKLHDKGLIEASYVLAGEGYATAVAKMAAGNSLGFDFNRENPVENLFKPSIGDILLQLNDKATDLEKIYGDVMPEDKGAQVFILGETREDGGITYGISSISVDHLSKLSLQTLENAFPADYEKEELYPAFLPPVFDSKPIKAKAKFAEPKVFVPVFQGSHSEYESIAAFEKAGAVVETAVFKNLTARDIKQSFDDFSRRIDEAQILFLPSSYCGEFEPGGNGKFIAGILRNERISEAINNLLYKRDGLMLGIGGGFQALLKAGFIYDGDINDPDIDDVSLTDNLIGRYFSGYAATKILTKKSPWLHLLDLDMIYKLPVSTYQGRIAAPDRLLRRLFENGQVAGIFVDESENPTMAYPDNPTGSAFAIEGLLSPDGRILGKLGHSERIGPNIAINIPGNKEQAIFESALAYYD